MSKSEEAMHGITFKDKIGYAMGDMGGLLTFGLVSAFLNMFYYHPRGTAYLLPAECGR